MAELVDALGSGPSPILWGVGSSPTFGTTLALVVFSLFHILLRTTIAQITLFVW